MSGKISADTLITALGATDDIPVVQGGANMRARAANFLALLIVPPQGRLTLTPSVPVLTATVSGATTVYYSPYVGRHVPINDGTRFVMTDIGGELSQATTDATKSPAAVANNSNYDKFVWSDAGTIRCTRGPLWTSDTGRGTGAGTTELVRVNGILVNNVAITNGPAANRGTYVGTIRSNGSAAIDWIYGALSAGGTAGRLCVWNMYNRVAIETMVRDDTNSWTVAAGVTGQAADNSATYRVSFVSGWAEDAFFGNYQAMCATAAANTGVAGVGLDSTTAFSGRWNTNNTASTTRPIEGDLTTTALGFHYISAMDASAGSNSSTFYGDGGGTTIQTGLLFRGRF